METTLFNLFAAAADGASVHVRHRLKESGIKLDWVFRFGKREFRDRSVKLELQALQKNRMKNSTFGALPAQDAVSQNQLNALGFTVDAAIKRIKGLEDVHRLPCGLFRASPFVAQGCPAAEHGQPRWICRELHC